MPRERERRRRAGRRIAARRGTGRWCDVGGGSRRKQRILSPRPSSPSVFIKPSKWLAFICSCDVSVKPAGSGKMIDVRSIPFAIRGAPSTDLSERKRDGGRKGRERKRERKHCRSTRRFSREGKRDGGRSERGPRQPERLEHHGRGIPRDVLMVLEIENAPGQPKWVWLPSLVPIVSVGWNFGAKWRACDDIDERGLTSIPSGGSIFSVTCSSSYFIERLFHRHYSIAVFDLRSVLLSCYRFLRSTNP